MPASGSTVSRRNRRLGSAVIVSYEHAQSVRAGCTVSTVRAVNDHQRPCCPVPYVYTTVIGVPICPVDLRIGRWRLQVAFPYDAQSVLSVLSVNSVNGHLIPLAVLIYIRLLVGRILVRPTVLRRGRGRREITFPYNTRTSHTFCAINAIKSIFSPEGRCAEITPYAVSLLPLAYPFKRQGFGNANRIIMPAGRDLIVRL